MAEKLTDNRQIKFRVNEAEYAYLSAIAQQSGLSMAQLCKNEMLGIRYKQPKFDLEQSKMLARELRNYGNNLNQIAKQLNSTTDYMLFSQIKEMSATLAAIEKGVHDIWAQLSQ